MVLGTSKCLFQICVSDTGSDIPVCLSLSLVNETSIIFTVEITLKSHLNVYFCNIPDDHFGFLLTLFLHNSMSVNPLMPLMLGPTQEKNFPRKISYLPSISKILSWWLGKTHLWVAAVTLYRALSTHNFCYFMSFEKQMLFMEKNFIKHCSIKSTQKWQHKQQSPFQYLWANFSLLSSCLMEGRRLFASYSSAPFTLMSFKCRTCTCCGFFSLRFKREKLGLLIRMEKLREKNTSISTAKGILTYHILKEAVF